MTKYITLVDIDTVMKKYRKTEDRDIFIMINGLQFYSKNISRMNKQLLAYEQQIVDMMKNEEYNKKLMNEIISVYNISKGRLSKLKKAIKKKFGTLNVMPTKYIPVTDLMK